MNRHSSSSPWRFFVWVRLHASAVPGYRAGVQLPFPACAQLRAFRCHPWWLPLRCPSSRLDDVFSRCRCMAYTAHAHSSLRTQLGTAIYLPAVSCHICPQGASGAPSPVTALGYIVVSLDEPPLLPSVGRPSSAPAQLARCIRQSPLTPPCPLLRFCLRLMPLCPT